MLPPIIHQCVYEALPSEYELPFFSDGDVRIGGFQIEKRVAYADAEPSYPLLTWEFSLTGAPRDTDPSDSGTLSEGEGEIPPSEPSSSVHLYDELTVTLATKGYHFPTDTTAHERVNILTPQILFPVRSKLPKLLRDAASHPDVPPVDISQSDISGATNSTKIVGGDTVAERTFTVQLNYTLSDVAEVDPVVGLDVGDVLSSGPGSESDATLGASASESGSTAPDSQP